MAQSTLAYAGAHGDALRHVQHMQRRAETRRKLRSVGQRDDGGLAEISRDQDVPERDHPNLLAAGVVSPGASDIEG